MAFTVDWALKTNYLSLSVIACLGVGLRVWGNDLYWYECVSLLGYWGKGGGYNMTT